MEHIFHEPEVFVAGPEQRLKIRCDVELFSDQAVKLPPMAARLQLCIFDADFREMDSSGAGPDISMLRAGDPLAGLGFLPRSAARFAAMTLLVLNTRSSLADALLIKMRSE